MEQPMNLPKSTWLRATQYLAAVLCAAIVLDAPSASAADVIQAGDYVITQESPLLRQRHRSLTAGAAIFVLKPSGKILTVARPPQVSGPRGIRQDRDGSFIFADPFAHAIMRLTRAGEVETVKRGAPLSAPKDVALDHQGGYVIADFPSFSRRSGGKVLRLSEGGKLSTVHAGAPLVWPHGIAVEEDGDIVIADHACCIYRMTPAGEVSLVAKGPPLVAPQDIKIGPDGDYVVTDIGLVIGRNGRADRSRSRNPARLLRVSPEGQVSLIGAAPRERFRAVAPAADGGWLVAEMQNGRIYHFDEGGARKVLAEGAPLVEPAGIVQVDARK
jgi:sugar lactone lactonase YvrE